MVDRETVGHDDKGILLVGHIVTLSAGVEGALGVALAPNQGYPPLGWTE
jgi:hypothetical protein